MKYFKGLLGTLAGTVELPDHENSHVSKEA